MYTTTQFNTSTDWLTMCKKIQWKHIEIPVCYCWQKTLYTQSNIKHKQWMAVQLNAYSTVSN